MTYDYSTRMSSTRMSLSDLDPNLAAQNKSDKDVLNAAEQTLKNIDPSLTTKASSTFSTFKELTNKTNELKELSGKITKLGEDLKKSTSDSKTGKLASEMESTSTKINSLKTEVHKLTTQLSSASKNEVTSSKSKINSALEFINAEIPKIQTEVEKIKAKIDDLSKSPITKDDPIYKPFTKLSDEFKSLNELIGKYIKNKDELTNYKENPNIAATDKIITESGQTHLKMKEILNRIGELEIQVSAGPQSTGADRLKQGIKNSAAGQEITKMYGTIKEAVEKNPKEFESIQRSINKLNDLEPGTKKFIEKKEQILTKITDFYAKEIVGLSDKDISGNMQKMATELQNKHENIQKTLENAYNKASHQYKTPSTDLERQEAIAALRETIEMLKIANSSFEEGLKKVKSKIESPAKEAISGMLEKANQLYTILKDNTEINQVAKIHTELPAAKTKFQTEFKR